MRDARVEEVERSADSDTDEPDKEGAEYTIGIFPASGGPTYLLIPNKQDKDAWLYHLTIVSTASQRSFEKASVGFLSNGLRYYTIFIN